MYGYHCLPSPMTEAQQGILTVAITESEPYFHMSKIWDTRADQLSLRRV